MPKKPYRPEDRIKTWKSRNELKEMPLGKLEDYSPNPLREDKKGNV